MQVVSQTFKDAFKSRNRLLDARIKHNGAISNELRVINFDIEEVFGEEDDIAIGLFSSKELKIKFKVDTDQSSVQVGDSLEVEMRGYDENSETWSEFLTMGKYFVDSTPEFLDGYMTVIAYDGAIFSDQLYETNKVFPISMQEFFNDLNAIVNYALDTSVQINPLYEIPFYNNTEPYSIRELIGYIAGAHACNARLNREGELEFVPIVSSPSSVESVDVSNMMEYTELNPIRKVTNVILSTETQNFEFGSGLKYESIYGFNPFADQMIVEDIHSVLNGFQYKPISMSWTFFPYLDAGDFISITKPSGVTWLGNPRKWSEETRYWIDNETINTIIMNNKISFSGGLNCETVNEGLSKQEIEYRVGSQIERRLTSLNKNAVKTTNNYYGVSINSDVGIEITRDDLFAKAIFNADEIALKVGNGLGSYTDALSFDAVNNRYKFVGEIVVEAVTGLDADNVNETSDRKWAGESGADITGNNTALDTTNVNGLDSSIISNWNYTGKTTIDGGNIETDTITALQINVAELSAITANLGSVTSGTINVDTNCSVGDKFTLGNPTGSRVDLQRSDSGGFLVGVTGDDILRLFTNSMFVDGNIGIKDGSYIGVIDNLYDTRRNVIYFTNNLIRIGGSGSTYIPIYFEDEVYMQDQDINDVRNLYARNIYGYNGGTVDVESELRIQRQIGFYGQSPVTKDSVSNLTSLTAGSSYGSTEQTMLNRLYDKVDEIIDVFQRNGMF